MKERKKYERLMKEEIIQNKQERKKQKRGRESVCVFVCVTEGMCEREKGRGMREKEGAGADYINFDGQVTLQNSCQN